jgi:predicted NBD/HSP70 family sugar kinase
MTETLVAGLDLGGTSINAVIFDAAAGRFLVDELCETPSLVLGGPDATMTALRRAFDTVATLSGVEPVDVRYVGLGTPGPASAAGVLSTRGSTNFSDPVWHGFDIRTAAQRALGRPVWYSNDGNAAALYGHITHFGGASVRRSSVTAVVGTGLGGGIVIDGRIVTGMVGMAGEVGHVHIPLDGVLEQWQAVPSCNCGNSGDAESVASLGAITRNLLPDWLSRHPDHPLAGQEPRQAARQLRTFAVAGDPLALAVFRQQATAIGRLFTILANVLDPDAYFVGGGVMEADEGFRRRFLADVRSAMTVREEQRTRLGLLAMPDLDRAGARGAALAAAQHLPNQPNALESAALPIITKPSQP